MSPSRAQTAMWLGMKKGLGGFGDSKSLWFCAQGSGVKRLMSVPFNEIGIGRVVIGPVIGQRNR